METRSFLFYLQHRKCITSVSAEASLLTSFLLSLSSPVPLRLSLALEIHYFFDFPLFFFLSPSDFNFSTNIVFFQMILLTKKRDENDAQKVWVRYFGVLHHQQGRYKEKLLLVHLHPVMQTLCSPGLRTAHPIFFSASTWLSKTSQWEWLEDESCWKKFESERKGEEG